MQFFYLARDPSGNEVQGEIEAESRIQAAKRLFTEKKLTLVEISLQADSLKAKSVKGQQAGTQNLSTALSQQKKYFQAIVNFFRNLNDWLITSSQISAPEKTNFFQLLSVMINAGLPIIKSLKILSGQTSNKNFARILANVAERVTHGNSFSAALSNYAKIFTEAEIGTIEVGEASGQLAKTLAHLAIEAEKSTALKRKISSAMIYPALVIAILIGAIFLVMLFVIPKMKELFLEIEVELPLATSILIDISNWFLATSFGLPNWLLPILVIGIFLLWLKFWKATLLGKYLWHKFLLNLPIFGTLNRKAILAEFSRQISLLTLAGVPIIKTLDITASAVGNEVFKRSILVIRKGVERGVPIYQTISKDPFFPKLITGMIAVGEKTAQLGPITKKIAEIYDQEVDTFVKNLTTIIEPTVVIILSFFIIGFIVAVMGPILKIMDFVSTV